MSATVMWLRGVSGNGKHRSARLYVPAGCVLFFFVSVFGYGKGSVEERYVFEGIEQIRVEAAVFAVSVLGAEGGLDGDTPSGSSGGTVLVRVSHPSVSVYRVKVHASEGVLTVHAERTLRSLRTGYGMHRIEIQAQGHIGLEMVTASGSMDIHDWNGDMRIGSNTGAIVLDGFRGSVVSTTDTGSQRITGGSGDIEANSGTGSIRLLDVRGRLHIASETGSIVGSDVVLAGDSVLTTTTGAIDLDLGNDLADVRFDLESALGRIRVGDDELGTRFAGGQGNIRLRGTTETGSQTIR